MPRHSNLNDFVEEMLCELEDELESETGKTSYKWVVSHSPFAQGFEIVDSLSTGEEKYTRNDALARQSAVIQMAYKTLKKAGASGSIKVERFVRSGDRWRKDRTRDDDACSKADLSGPYLRITSCWP